MAVNGALLERLTRDPIALPERGLLDQWGRPLKRGREIARLGQIADWLDARMSAASPQPTNPVNISAEGVANASGNVAFSFEPVPNGLALEGTCTIVGSPVGAQWTLTANGLTLGQWTGTSTGGPFIVAGPASPTLTGTGLTSGAQVTATFIGNQGDPSSFSSYPASLPGSVNISALGVGVVLYPLQATPLGGGNLTPVALAPTTRTLLLNIVTNNGLYNVEVIGGTSNYAYYLQAPYLAGLGTFNNLCVVPVNPTLDPVVYIRLLTNTGSTTCTMEAVGDTAQYQESIFYNGTPSGQGAVSLSAAGTETFLNGPCRLHNVSFQTQNGQGAGINWEGTFVGNYIARLDSSTAPGVSMVLPFQEDTILPLGNELQLVQFGTGFSTASGTSAYP